MKLRNIEFQTISRKDNKMLTEKFT